jgi:hypothetical protein
MIRTAKRVVFILATEEIDQMTQTESVSLVKALGSYGTNNVDAYGSSRQDASRIINLTTFPKDCDLELVF